MAHLMLGRTLPSRSIGFRFGTEHRAEIIVDRSDQPLLTIAPTGAGKGTSALIPAALTWPGQLVVVDVKGEVLAVTARARLAMGQKVFALAPFGLPWPPPNGVEIVGLNPLDMIDPASPDAPAEARTMAAALLPEGAIKADRFWRDQAMNMLAGLALWLRRYAPLEAQTLARLRSVVCTSDREISEVTHAMRLAGKAEMSRAFADNTIGDTARSLEQLAAADRTYASVMQTIDVDLAPLASPALAPALRTTQGLLDGLTAGHAITLYLVFPPHRLASHAGLIRLWLTMLTNRLAQRRNKPEVPTLMLVDEAAQIGPVEALRTAYSLLRGFGVKPWMFFQSAAQIDNTYGAHGAELLDNAAILQMFGSMTPALAAAIRRYTGDTIDPWALKREEQVLCMAGQLPSIASRVDYRRDAVLHQLASPNPFFCTPAREAA